MNGYDKIYIALTQGRDDAWKKRVDETIARFKGEGMTDLMAMKHAAMELNVERTPMDAKGTFLKAYTTRNGESLFNIVVDGITMPVSGDKPLELPKYPSDISITKAEMVKNLMTKKTWLEITDQSEIKVGNGANPEDLLKQAKFAADVPDGDYALVLGAVTELRTVKKDETPQVTPEGTNLKLNFKSGDIRTGCFVGDLGFLSGVLPSRADQKKMDELVAAGDWGEVVRYFNEVCGENREFGMTGCDILVYGKVADNKWKDRDGNERIGKNIKVSVGGFIYSVDLLYELMNPALQKEGLEAFHDAGTPAQEVAEVRDAVVVQPPTPTPTPAPSSEIEAPEGKSIETTIMDVLNDAKDGLAPQELLGKVNVQAEELSQKLTALHKAGKVQLKDGRFYAKRKK